MPLLQFDVYANYEEVARLNREIARIQAQMRSFSPGSTDATLQRLNRQLADNTARLKELSRQAQLSGAQLELGIKRGVNGAIASINSLQEKISSPLTGLTEIAGVAALGGFLSKVANIRGQFQLMETNISTLLGSAEKGQRMMADLQEYAKVSPLDFQGTVGAAQMMLGFGIDQQKILPFMKALGDVSMGDAQRFQSLTLAFSQMSAAGKLMGQDLMQMVNAGFQPLNQLAKDTGKSIGTLKEEMSKGKISAEMVQQAFINATSEGGKYFNMSQAATSTISGQMSMLGDATDLMFNDIGKASEGMIIKAIQGATWLVENYEKVGAILLTAISTFGVYKASVMAMEYAEKVAAEEKTKAVVEGYTKQIEAMQAYEAAKAAAPKDPSEVPVPEAVEKMKRGEALSDKELDDISAYTERITALQAEKEAREGVSSAIQEEIDRLRELNGEKEVPPPPPPAPKLDDDLQSIVDNSGASLEEIVALQEQRDLMVEKLILAEEETATWDGIVGKAQADLDVARQRREAADELVDQLLEEYDLFQEIESLDPPLGADGEEIESTELLAKAKEMERAEREQTIALQEEEEAQRRLNAAQEALQEAQTNETTASINLQRAATTQNNTETAANTLARTTNTSAQASNTSATNTNTAAQKSNGLAMVLNTARMKLATVGQHLWNSAINMGKQAINGLKAAWMSNPIGLIITGVTALIGLFMSFKKETEEANAEVERFGEATVKTQRNVDILYAVMNSVSRESKVFRDATDELIKLHKDYHTQLSTSIDKLTTEEEKVRALNAARAELNDLILREGEARQIANTIASITQDKENADKKYVEDLTKQLEGHLEGEYKEYSAQFARIIADSVSRNSEEFNRLRGEIEKLTNEQRENYSSERYKEITALKEQLYQLAIAEAEATAQNMGLQGGFGHLKYHLTDSSDKIYAYVDKLTGLDKMLHSVTERQEKLSATAPPKIETAMAEKSVEDLGKMLRDTGDAADDLKGKEVATKVDSTQAEEAKDKVDGATAAVGTHDATEGSTKVDSSQAVTAQGNIEGATSALAILNQSTARPTISTAGLMPFMNTLNEAMGKFQMLGGDLKKPTEEFDWYKWVTGKDNPNKPGSENGGKTETPFERAYAELERRFATTNMDSDFDAIYSQLNTSISTYAQGSAERKKLEKLKKRYEAKDSRKKKSNKSKKNTGKSAEETAWDEAQAQKKEQERLERLQLEAENERAELHIAQLEDNHEREIATIKLNAKKRREEMEQAIQDEVQHLIEVERQAWVRAKKARKAFQWKQVKTDAQYREEAMQNLDSATDAAAINLDESTDLAKIYREDMKALWDYLKEFGSFQQQRYAMAQDYQQRIREAMSEGERLSLKAQWRRDDQQNRANELMEKIDWFGVFDGLGLVFESQLRPMYERLQEYVQTDAFRSSGAENQRRVVEAMESLRQQLGDTQSWDDLAKAMTEYQQALTNLRLAEEKDDSNQAELQRLAGIVEQARVRMQANPADTEAVTAFETAKTALEDFATQVQESNQALEEARSAVQTQGLRLSQTAKNVMQPMSKIHKFLEGAGFTQLAELWGAFDQVKGAINGLKGIKAAAEGASELAETLPQAAEGVQEVAEQLTESVPKTIKDIVSSPEFIRRFNEIIENFAEGGEEVVEGTKKAADGIPKEITDSLEKAGIWAQLIAGILKILEILKDGIGPLIQSILDTVLNAISGIISNILNFRDGLFRQIGESLYQGILGIFKSIFTLGGWFDWWGDGESDKTLETDIERLTDTNDALRKAIDGLADRMNESAVADATGIYKQQKEDLESAMKNTQEMMSRSGAAYSNGFLGIGGKHSSNHEIEKNMSEEDWERISKAAGTSVKNINDFWNLTSEQMNRVLEQTPDLFGKIKTFASKGHKDASQFMEEYAEYYKELKELQEAWMERLTDTSFDSISSEFKSMLLDMESSSEDFANNFEKMMQQAVINSLMSARYNERLKAWYEKFAKSMEGEDATITAEEQAALKKEWDQITADALEERDRLKRTMGWDGSETQQASSRTLQGMTQDTAEAIEGSLTALQIAVESIRTQETAHTLSLADITNEMLEIALEYNRFNVHQENIERQLAKMYLELQTISENTGAIIDPIITMQQDIADIRRNTRNL